MRLFLLSSLALLWGHYLLFVAPPPAAPLASVGGEGLAARLNDDAARSRHAGDALALLEKAAELAPGHPAIAANLEAARARALDAAWRRILLPASALLGTLLLAGAVRRRRDRRRLRAIRVLGEPHLAIGAAEERALFRLPLNRSPGRLVRRHPLTIVWSSAAHGRHMKSRPPARLRDGAIEVTLDRDRLARLRACPGAWRAFLYLGETRVGEATARVAS